MVGRPANWREVRYPTPSPHSDKASWESKHRQCVRVVCSLTDSESWDEAEQIKQALQDLFEAFPAWDFAAKRIGFDDVLRAPSAEARHAEYLARVLDMTDEAMRR